MIIISACNEAVPMYNFDQRVSVMRDIYDILFSILKRKKKKIVYKKKVVLMSFFFLVIRDY